MEKEVKIVRTVSHLNNEAKKMEQTEVSVVKSFGTVRDAIDYLMSVGHRAFVKGLGKIIYRAIRITGFTAYRSRRARRLL